MPRNMRPKGTGTITKTESGRWRVRVTKGRRSDGRKRVVSRTVDTREEAEAMCIRLSADMGASSSLGDSLTLRRYYYGIFRDSPSSRGEKRSAATLRQYDAAMERFVLPALGDRPVHAITHGDMKACVRAASAPHGCKTVLRAVMRAAYDDELIEEKPFERRVATPRRHREQAAPWTAQEAVTAFRALQGSPVEPYLILGLSGLRKEEALAVCPDCIRVEASVDIATGEVRKSVTVAIERTYTDDDGLRSKTKTEFSRRTMPVIVAGRERLLAILADTRPDDPQAVEGWMRTRLIPWGGNWFARVWRREIGKAGLRYIPPDMLRHTSETLMQAACLPDTLVSRLHGHTEVQTDYRHYLRPGADQAESAAEAVHKMMLEEVDGDARRRDADYTKRSDI